MGKSSPVVTPIPEINGAEGCVSGCRIGWHWAGPYIASWSTWKVLTTFFIYKLRFSSHISTHSCEWSYILDRYCWDYEVLIASCAFNVCRLFNLQCLHIPVHDRTPFTGTSDGYFQSWPFQKRLWWFCLLLQCHQFLFCMGDVEFSGLLKLVEETILTEHERRPTSPIYLIGDSFGGALALSVAARNPSLDLVLIVANPG